MNNMVQVEGMSSGLTEIVQELRGIREALLLIALRDSKETKATRDIDGIVSSAYAALSRLGPNMSAIAEEVGVHRHTLMNSKAPHWVKWRDMFERVKRSRGI